MHLHVVVCMHTHAFMHSYVHVLCWYTRICVCISCRLANLRNNLYRSRVLVHCVERWVQFAGMLLRMNFTWCHVRCCPYSHTAWLMLHHLFRAIYVAIELLFIYVACHLWCKLLACNSCVCVLLYSFPPRVNIARLSFRYSLITFGANTAIDAPDNYFRVQLTSSLLEICGPFFDRGKDKKNLDQFLVYFQRYSFCLMTWNLIHIVLQ